MDWQMDGQRMNVFINVQMNEWIAPWMKPVIGCYIGRGT